MEDTIPKGRGALDAFINLLNLITLGWVAIWLGRVVFWLVNKFFSPQFIAYRDQSEFKFGIASLIIVVPIFLFLAGYLHRLYKSGRLSPQSGIHKWLTYLMLLISSLTIIGDLVALVFKLLSGDYTLSFFLKVITILVIGGAIFGYYAYDLRRHDYTKRSKTSVGFMAGVIVVCLVAVIGGFLIIDSPAVARMRSFDLQRANNLSELDNLIIFEFQNTGKLPNDLSASKFSSFVDPVTNQLYGYKALGDNEYQLCAKFDLAVDKNNKESFIPYANDWFFHDAGLQCFNRRVTQEKPGLPVPVRQVQ